MDEDRLAALIDKMAEGDTAALRELVELTGPHIHAAHLRITGTTVAAAVLVEETLTELWVTAPLYDLDQGSPWVWVMAVTRATGTRWVDRRKGKERRLKSRPDAAALLAGGEGTGDPPARAALEAMEPDDAAILRRAWFEGLPGGTQGAPDTERVASALPELVRRLAEPGGQP